MNDALPKLYTDEASFKLLVDALPVPTAIYQGRHMVISAANQAMLKAWGKNASVIGKPLKEALPELEGQPFHQLLANIYMNGNSYEATEDRVDLFVDGKLQSYYFTFTYKAIQDANGRTAAIINTAVDVTELVLTRKRCEAAEEYFSFALQSAGVGTWDLDPLNNIVKWDKRCRELFGVSREGDVLYKDVLACIHPSDEDLVHRSVMDAINPKTKGGYDVRYRTVGHADQQVRWVHCKGKAYFTNDGRAYRFAGTAQDITAEVRIHQSEQQMLSLVNNNADFMSIADMAGRLIYMNYAARNMLGVEPDNDITRYSAADFYTPDELERVQMHIIPKISEHTGWEGNVNLRNVKTKEVIPFLVKYILIKDPETGEVIGRGATARDLRPEIVAKAELQRLATIVDISEDFCNYCDINGNTIYLNKSGSDLIGLDRASITNRKLFDYHSSYSNELIEREILPHLRKYGKWSGRLELLHQVTGEIIPIHKQLFIIKDEISGEAVAIAGIAKDLRPELNARKSLSDKNSELNKAIKELGFLADTVPSVVWTSKPDGNLDYINQRWYDRSGKTITETLGAGWMDSLHPEDKPGAFAAWDHSLKTGDPYEIEFRCMDKEGNYRWYLVRALPLKDEQGNIIKWYGTNTDVQEQKELVQQKDNFLGVASHELKTPVTSIKAYVQVMESMFRRSGDVKNADLLGKINKQVDRLSSLISDLLDVTKINTGRLQFNPVSFNFNQMVEEVVEDVQRTSGKHEISRQLKFDKGLVYGDREKISQVVINLLTNAIKYSPDASRIIIYTEYKDSCVQLCVQDFGIGIHPEKKDRVFEQFYRVSGTREHTFPGLGLGLYICSEIVIRMGGKIWVNSVESKGSTFCFSIPLVTDSK